MDVGRLGGARGWVRAALPSAVLLLALLVQPPLVLAQQARAGAKQGRSGPASSRAASERAPNLSADRDEKPPTVAPALYRQISIEDPSRRSLAAFHAALRRARAGQGQARMVFYGASHVAGEMFTGPLRQRLQTRFGEAGPGFVSLIKPWSWYHHRGIRLDDGKGFKPLRVNGSSGGGPLGLAGVALDARPGKPARGAIETRSEGGLAGRASHFALYYLRQPRGGKFSVFLDGQHRQDISTAAPHAETGYARFEAEDGLHRFELRTAGDGPVRVFGVAVERSEPGVILDMLGLPGARARDQLAWEDRVYREHLASRMPDLVVLAYGTNEAGDDGVPIAQYEQGLRRVVERVRDVVPYASCLLIGPSDRPRRVRGTGYVARPLTSAIIETQRRVAAESGCGFFDLRAFMGGEMAMLRWVKARPALGAPDHVHFTHAGYEHLASVLYDALLAGFDEESTARGETLASTPPGSPTVVRVQDLSPLAR